MLEKQTLFGSPSAELLARESGRRTRKESA